MRAERDSSELGSIEITFEVNVMNVAFRGTEVYYLGAI
jgi:hypothetical protein